MSRALVTLAEKGVEAEAAARESLNHAYRRFMSEGNAEQKNEASRDLIRTLFGSAAIACFAGPAKYRRLSCRRE
jgi:hypothetical protein